MAFKQLPELSKKVLGAKKNQINNIFAQNNIIFKQYLKTIKVEEILLIVILLSVGILKITSIYKEPKKDLRPYSPPFAAMAQRGRRRLSGSGEANHQRDAKTQSLTSFVTFSHS